MKKAFIDVIEKATGKVVKTIEQDSNAAAIEYCQRANKMFLYYTFRHVI